MFTEPGPASFSGQGALGWAGHAGPDGTCLVDLDVDDCELCLLPACVQEAICLEKQQGILARQPPPTSAAGSGYSTPGSKSRKMVWFVEGMSASPADGPPPALCTPALPAQSPLHPFSASDGAAQQQPAPGRDSPSSMPAGVGAGNAGSIKTLSARSSVAAMPSATCVPHSLLLRNGLSVTTSLSSSLRSSTSSMAPAVSSISKSVASACPSSASGLRRMKKMASVRTSNSTPTIWTPAVGLALRAPPSSLRAAAAAAASKGTVISSLPPAATMRMNPKLRSCAQPLSALHHCSAAYASVDLRAGFRLARANAAAAAADSTLAPPGHIPSAGGPLPLATASIAGLGSRSQGAQLVTSALAPLAVDGGSSICSSLYGEPLDLELLDLDDEASCFQCEGTEVEVAWWYAEDVSHPGQSGPGSGDLVAAGRGPEVAGRASQALGGGLVPGSFADSPSASAGSDMFGSIFFESSRAIRADAAALTEVLQQPLALPTPAVADGPGPSGFELTGCLCAEATATAEEDRAFAAASLQLAEEAVSGAASAKATVSAKKLTISQHAVDSTANLMGGLPDFSEGEEEEEEGEEEDMLAEDAVSLSWLRARGPAVTAAVSAVGIEEGAARARQEEAAPASGVASVVGHGFPSAHPTGGDSRFGVASSKDGSFGAVDGSSWFTSWLDSGLGQGGSVGAAGKLVEASESTSSNVEAACDRAGAKPCGMSGVDTACAPAAAPTALSGGATSGRSPDVDVTGGQQLQVGCKAADQCADTTAAPTGRKPRSSWMRWLSCFGA